MIEFVDCPHCGKRVRTNALRCYRCGGQLLPRREDFVEECETASMASVYGGYDTRADDFENECLDEELRDGERKRKLWYYVAWILIVAMTFPVVLQAISLLPVK